MKIAYIIPGSGGSFYCQNCMRDSELIKSLRESGLEIYTVPLYLPINVEKKEPADPTLNGIPIFYGAINIYLKEILPFYRHVPEWFEKIFDSQPFLRYAAKKSESTRAAGMEEMTISMLMGEDGRQATELDHLIRFMKNEIKPDIVHLSNALLLGLAHRLKRDLGAKIVCSLQDENEWIDPMNPEFQNKIWDLMAEKGTDVDLFLSASNYYSEKAQKKLKIPDEKIQVIYEGINLQGYENSLLPFDPPVIGFLSRMSEQLGLGIIVDAFIRLKTDPAMKGHFERLQLHLTGGYSGDDKMFIEKMMKKIAEHGIEADVQIFEDFSRESRIEFLKKLTLLSVPVPSGEAFGTYQLEALAAGVPIVQPNVGGSPEFIESTGGGIIYEPNTGEKLANSMASLLNNPEKIRELGERGRKAVGEKYLISDTARNIIDAYAGIKSFERV